MSCVVVWTLCPKTVPVFIHTFFDLATRHGNEQQDYIKRCHQVIVFKLFSTLNKDSFDDL